MFLWWLYLVLTARKDNSTTLCTSDSDRWYLGAFSRPGGMSSVWPSGVSVIQTSVNIFCWNILMMGLSIIRDTLKYCRAPLVTENAQVPRRILQHNLKATRRRVQSLLSCDRVGQASGSVGSVNAQRLVLLGIDHESRVYLSQGSRAQRGSSTLRRRGNQKRPSVRPRDRKPETGYVRNISS